MKFTNIEEVFNHYRNSTLEDIEKRSDEIENEVNTNPNADMKTINIEIEGLMKVKENIQDKKSAENNITQLRNFNPITGMEVKTEQKLDTENIFDSSEYRSAFYKQMLGQDLTDIEQRAFNYAMDQQKQERRADAFNSTTNSSAVLPTQTLNEVIKKARQEGGLIAHVRSFNMPTRIRIPIGTPTDKAEWHTEGTLVNSEKVNLAAVEFEGYEILKVFSMSVATRKMSVSAFESYITQELTDCVMETIADSLVNGTGVKQGTGLLTGITWDETNTVDLTGNYTDFTNALAKLKRGYSARAKFAMSNATLYNSVYSLVDGNKRPIFIQDPKNESIGHILGKEVIIDDHIEDGVILLGDFNYMAFNMPAGMMLEVSTESSFRSGLVDYRAMAIADTKPLVDEAFIKITGTTESTQA